MTKRLGAYLLLNHFCSYIISFLLSVAYLFVSFCNITTNCECSMQMFTKSPQKYF